MNQTQTERLIAATKRVIALTNWCGQNAGIARSEALHAIEALESAPHDFGWALEQMRAGRKVRRKEWGRKSCVEKRREDAIYWCGPDDRAGGMASLSCTSLLATDWQLYEEPKREEPKKYDMNCDVEQRSYQLFTQADMDAIERLSHQQGVADERKRIAELLK